MKPYVRRKSDFLGSNPIIVENAAGIIITREGGKYNIAVDIDVDTVVQIDKISNKEVAFQMVEKLLPEVDNIQRHYQKCRPD